MVWKTFSSTTILSKIRNKCKEIELERPNTNFIVVRPPLPMSTLLKLLTKWGFHYPCNFNQASKVFTLRFWLQWVLTQSFKYSPTWNFLFTQPHLINNEGNSQPSSINSQIHKKARMNDKRCTKGCASEESMYQRERIFF